MSLNKFQLIHAMSLLSIDDLGLTQDEDRRVYIPKQNLAVQQA